jgi:4-hydroxy-3-polyprenylbenzoate decarboxylase
MSEPHRVIVGISGASGAAVGIRIVELLADLKNCELHLVVSAAAERTIALEVSSEALSRLAGLVHRHHGIDEIGATIASGSYQTSGMIVAPCSVRRGSYQTSGMIVAPCSVRSLSAIANGNLDNLLVRAADVHLKEPRRLVLLVRETPLHLGHIRSMAQVTEIGAIVAPLAPAFYLRPRSLDEMIDHMALRSIALLGIDELRVRVPEWTGGAPGHPNSLL